MFNPAKISIIAGAGCAAAPVAAALVAQTIVFEATAAESGRRVVASVESTISVNGQAATVPTTAPTADRTMTPMAKE
jgi:hypothetical protein